MVVGSLSHWVRFWWKNFTLVKRVFITVCKVPVWNFFLSFSERELRKYYGILFPEKNLVRKNTWVTEKKFRNIFPENRFQNSNWTSGNSIPELIFTPLKIHSFLHPKSIKNMRGARSNFPSIICPWPKSATVHVFPRPVQYSQSNSVIDSKPIFWTFS